MTDPQRERALELARNWLAATQQEYRESLADLLLEFARAARLEEAGKWYAVIPYGGADQANRWAADRLAQLQQPAKKGTQP